MGFCPPEILFSLNCSVIKWVEAFITAYFFSFKIFHTLRCVPLNFFRPFLFFLFSIVRIIKLSRPLCRGASKSITLQCLHRWCYFCFLPYSELQMPYHGPQLNRQLHIKQMNGHRDRPIRSQSLETCLREAQSMLMYVDGLEETWLNPWVV